MAELIAVTRAAPCSVTEKNVMRLPSDVRGGVRPGVAFENIDSFVENFVSLKVQLNDFVSDGTTDREKREMHVAIIVSYSLFLFTDLLLFLFSSPIIPISSTVL